MQNFFLALSKKVVGFVVTLSYSRRRFRRIAANVSAAWRSGGGTQRLGRATNFQSPAKLSGEPHPA
jgi:hypothetical protein